MRLGLCQHRLSHISTKYSLYSSRGSDYIHRRTTESIFKFLRELVPSLGVVERGTEAAIEIGEIGVDWDGLVREGHGGM